MYSHYKIFLLMKRRMVTLSCKRDPVYHFLSSENRNMFCKHTVFKYTMSLKIRVLVIKEQLHI